MTKTKMIVNTEVLPDENLRKLKKYIEEEMTKKFGHKINKKTNSHDDHDYDKEPIRYVLDFYDNGNDDNNGFSVYGEITTKDEKLTIDWNYLRENSYYLKENGRIGHDNRFKNFKNNNRDEENIYGNQLYFEILNRSNFIYIKSWYPNNKSFSEEENYLIYLLKNNKYKRAVFANECYPDQDSEGYNLNLNEPYYNQNIMPQKMTVDKTYIDVNSYKNEDDVIFEYIIPSKTKTLTLNNLIFVEGLTSNSSGELKNVMPINKTVKGSRIQSVKLVKRCEKFIIKYVLRGKGVGNIEKRKVKENKFSPDQPIPFKAGPISKSFFVGNLD